MPIRTGGKTRVKARLGTLCLTRAERSYRFGLMLKMKTRGAIELLRYLQDRKISQTSFAKEHGLSRAFLHRVLSGLAGGRISADFAFRVQCATRGKIPMDRWVSPDIRTAAAAA